MSRRSYSNEAISHLVGMKFFCSKWDPFHVAPITITVHPDTKKFVYKVDGVFFENVNQVGCYLKGRINMGTYTDSRLRPAMLTNCNGDSLQVLVENESYVEKKETSKKIVHCSNVDKLEGKLPSIAKKFIKEVYKFGKPISQDDLYKRLKLNYKINFTDRKKVVRALIQDGLMVKYSNLTYEFNSEVLA